MGLARNVRQLYRELAGVYDPGDRIFLFGFSRGAFTVRTLAGLIVRCGILSGLDVSRLRTAKALEDAVDETHDAYRAGYDSYLTRVIGRVLRWPNREKAVAALHEKYPFHPAARIADTCLVWHLGFQGLLRHHGRGRQVFHVVNAIDTAYRLQASSAEERPSAQPLQDHPFEAAQILLREDLGVLTKACGWFREKGFAGVKC